MTQEILTFDADTHTYRIGDRIVPTVTQIIREVLAPNEYAGVPLHALDRAAKRGRAVERMIELDLAAELDTDSLHPELLPYWHGWQSFPDRAAWQNDPDWLSQGRVYSPVRHYAGTFDLWLPSAHALVDIKATALVPSTVGIQTAAYADAMVPPEDGASIKRYCLHVTPTRCTLIPLTDKSDSADFLAALRVYNWRHRHDA